jgi:hypothetical protein
MWQSARSTDSIPLTVAGLTTKYVIARDEYVVDDSYRLA